MTAFQTGSRGFQDRCPDILKVVLDPARLRKNLLKFGFVLAEEPALRIKEHYRGAGRALGQWIRIRPSIILAFSLQFPLRFFSDVGTHPRSINHPRPYRGGGVGRACHGMTPERTGCGAFDQRRLF